MTIEKSQLRHLIKRVLKPFGTWSQAAEDLLIGTAAQESCVGTYITQIKGPAKGIFQMEPATEKDLWEYIVRKDLHYLVGTVSGVFGPNPLHLEGNLIYQIIMARIFYLRVKERIPDGIEAQARYYKKYWNTEAGKATVEQYMKNVYRYA